MNLLKTKDKTKQDVWLNVEQIVSFKKGSVSMVDGKVYHLPEVEFAKLMGQPVSVADKYNDAVEAISDKPKPQRKTTRKKAATKRSK